jgi:hypothetical protein
MEHAKNSGIDWKRLLEVDVVQEKVAAGSHWAGRGWPTLGFKVRGKGETGLREQTPECQNFDGAGALKKERLQGLP